MNKPPAQQIQLELREAEAEGIYSNLVMIGHSPSEIIFDFARFLPGTPKARVFARHTQSVDGGIGQPCE